MSEVPAPFTDQEQHRHATAEGMWAFLATEALLFGTLFAAYVSSRLTWVDAFAEASRHTSLLLGTANTAILLSSSFTVAMALLRYRERGQGLAWLLATLALGTAFLGIKGYEYYLDYQQGLVPFPGFSHGLGTGVEVFFGLYFLSTALHALHLVIGLGLIAFLAWRLDRRGRVQGNRFEVIALYWHLVDVIWVFLFPLLYLVGRHGGPL